MIDVTVPIFPNNVVEVLAEALKVIDPVPDPPDGEPHVEIIKRPLRNTDPQQSIGIFAQAWSPDMESLEFMGGGNAHPQQPTLQTYTYGIQAFVKDYEEERGLVVHAYLAGMIRRVLYTFGPLRVALAALRVEFQDDSVEQLKRWGVNTARYFAGEVEGENLYLATIEFWVETETRSIA